MVDFIGAPIGFNLFIQGLVDPVQVFKVHQLMQRYTTSSGRYITAIIDSIIIIYLAIRCIYHSIYNVNVYPFNAFTVRIFNGSLPSLACRSTYLLTLTSLLSTCRITSFWASLNGKWLTWSPSTLPSLNSILTRSLNGFTPLFSIFCTTFTIHLFFLSHSLASYIIRTCMIAF